MAEDNTETLDAFYFMVREPNGAIGHRFTDTFADLALTHARLGIAMADMLRFAEELCGLDPTLVSAAMVLELEFPTERLTGKRVN